MWDRVTNRRFSLDNVDIGVNRLNYMKFKI